MHKVTATEEEDEEERDEGVEADEGGRQPSVIVAVAGRARCRPRGMRKIYCIFSGKD